MNVPYLPGKFLWSDVNTEFWSKVCLLTPKGQTLWIQNDPNRLYFHSKTNETQQFLKLILYCSSNVNKKVQLDATICRHLFTAKSLYMFRASQHPSSGALKTVTSASGIGHNTGTATSFQRGRLRKEVVVPELWPIPEAAVTVFSAPDDGCCDARNM